jgi:hypothetical protein
MPDIVSKPAAPQRRKRDGIHVPGIYEWWHRARCAHTAQHALVDRDHDPRFADPDAPFDDIEREARLTEARRVAEATAAQAIARGKPIIGKLLRPRHRLGVWWERGSGVRVPGLGFEADALWDIYPDDTVVLNAVATEQHRAELAAEVARRKTAAAQPDPQLSSMLVNSTRAVERNGHAVMP